MTETRNLLYLFAILVQPTLKIICIVKCTKGVQKLEEIPKLARATWRRDTRPSPLLVANNCGEGHQAVLCRSLSLSPWIQCKDVLTHEETCASWRKGSVGHRTRLFPQRLPHLPLSRTPTTSRRCHREEHSEEVGSSSASTL